MSAYNLPPGCIPQDIDGDGDWPDESPEERRERMAAEKADVELDLRKDEP